MVNLRGSENYNLSTQDIQFTPLFGMKRISE